MPGGRADSRRRAGGDHVARLKRDELRQERHDRRHREDHLGRGGVLLDVTVDGELQRDRLRVGNHVGRQDARAHRAERVVPLAVHPVEKLVALARLAVGVGLERAVADVVDDRVAGDAAHRLVLVDVPAAAADHDGQLAFPVDLVGRDPGDHDRVAGVGQRRARGLHEDVGKRLLALGRRPAALGDVLGVVARQEQHLGRIGDRHQQPDVGRGDRQLVARDQVELLDPGVQLAGGFIRAAVGRQQVEQVLGGREQQLDTHIAAVGFGGLVDGNHLVVGVESRQDHLVKTEPADTHPSLLKLAVLISLLGGRLNA